MQDGTEKLYNEANTGSIWMTGGGHQFFDLVDFNEYFDAYANPKKRYSFKAKLFEKSLKDSEIRYPRSDPHFNYLWKMHEKEGDWFFMELLDEAFTEKGYKYLLEVSKYKK